MGKMTTMKADIRFSFKTSQYSNTSLVVWEKDKNESINAQNTVVYCSYFYQTSGLHSIELSDSIYLNCADNDLLSLSDFPSLEELRCSGNKLIELDLSKIVNLKILDVSNNKISILNVPTQSKFETIYCKNNQIGTAELNKMFNALTAAAPGTQRIIDISGNPGTDFCNVQIAIDKGWTVIDNKGLYAPPAPPVAPTGVSVFPPTLKMMNGEAKILTATVAPQNAANKEVTWSSNKPETVYVDQFSGAILALNTGTAKITAKTIDGGKTASCDVTVEAAPGSSIRVEGISFSPDTMQITKSATKNLTPIITPNNATNKSVEWASSNTSAVEVDQSGNISGKAIGTSNITATSKDGSNKKATCIVTVTSNTVAVTGISLVPDRIEVPIGATRNIAAVISPSNASDKSITWDTNDKTVATIDNSGNVTAKKAGAATITAKTNDGNKAASCLVEIMSDKAPTITPVNTVSLSPSSASMKVGDTKKLNATIVPSSATNHAITWSSSDNTIATVDETGNVEAKRKGTAIIAAVAHNGVMASCNVTVTAIVSLSPSIYSLLTQPVNYAYEQQPVQVSLYFKLKGIASPDETLSSKKRKTPIIKPKREQLPDYNLLKNKIQDKKLTASERIFKEELLTAKNYFADLEESKKNQEPFPEKWHPECPLEKFEKWFTPKLINDLLKLFEKQQETSASLIPIKGISKIMQAKLRDVGVFDTVSLLTKGRTQEKRNTLANNIDVNVKLVNSWVKQADLWRIDGMTTDAAYLLVQIGVRHSDDLAKLDVEKVYPIMERLVLAQPDFQLIDKDYLNTLIQKAEDYTNFAIDQKRLIDLLSDQIKNSEIALSELEKSDLEQKLKTVLNQSKNSISLNIETYEEAPLFLFKDKYKKVLIKTSGKIIEEGLGFLNDVVLALPLPHTISGYVYMKEAGKNFPAQSEEDGDLPPEPDVLVEISGISSPSDDKTEEEKNPSAYTDSSGYFLIILPDKYNLQESITLTISRDNNKQKFTKSALDVINSVPEQETLTLFDKLQTIKYFIQKNKSRLEHLIWINSIIGNEKYKELISPEKPTKPNQEMMDLYTEDELIVMEVEQKELYARKIDIEAEVTRLNDEYDETLDAIFESDGSGTTDLEIILSNLLSNNHLNSELGDFVLTQDIFEGYRTNQKKALPSVKLMGDNETGVLRLSTDTAPSRVFNYGMLQRLVEPAVDPPAANGEPRVTLSNPIDIMDFKTRMYSDPDSIPKMASLGIGYILNMHQAWVPDGFALGTLLYSLVLAPGEEQRLIVRENSQRYTVADDAEGTDATNESYNLSQMDDASASFNFAAQQMSNANSGYDFRSNAKSSTSSSATNTTTSTNDGGGVGGKILSLFGLSGLVSKTTTDVSTLSSSSSFSASNSGSGSSFASQNNAHNEASNTAQSFQHSIKSASNKISQSKRISVRTATSEERDSVATKIIANHNHSHAMTIQYWEVMRRYRLETCIDGVDLVLFVPLKLIRFLPQGQTYLRDLRNFNKTIFNERYNVLLQHADNLLYAMPYKYRTGMNLIKKYAALPEWTVENSTSGRNLTLKFNCDLLPCDTLKVYLVLKNGKGTIIGTPVYNRIDLSQAHCKTTNDLKQYIRDIRNNGTNKTSVLCNFDIPAGVLNDDLSHVRIDYSCENLEYELYKDITDTDEKKRLHDMIDSLYKQLYSNNLFNIFGKSSSFASQLQSQINSLLGQIPEAFRTPVITLSAKTITDLGSPTIMFDSLKIDTGSLSVMFPTNSLRTSLSLSIKSNMPTMLNSELQEMESVLHHVASDTLYYSQVIWSSLSEDELAMMLERYTIDMNFDNITEGLKAKETQDIPLLNCVNVKKRVGFYGNCILLPFTYPKKLAEKLGKTAAELQESLYRYHTNCFRVPTTTISLPTDGMIGEAVLGETNVSEPIDLTRFWNWKDSPIDKMNIDSSYLNSNDYLAGKAPSEITALNLQGANAATPVTVPDIISALINKQTPTFENITALQQLMEILNKGTDSATAGRDKLMENNADVTKMLIEYVTKAAEKEEKKDPNTPGLPGLPGIGDLPGLPGVGDLPGLPGVGDLPGLPGIGDPPGLPGLP